MDYWKNQLIELDDCLYNFNIFSFHDSAINLFRVLIFPVEEMEVGFSNLTIEELLRSQGENEEFINPSEKFAVSMIKTVSILFVLNNDSQGLEHVEEYNDGIFVGASIIVIGIEIFENDNFQDEYYDNQYIIPAITTFFNRLINTQILILFKRDSKIAFSVKRRRINKKDETSDTKGSNFQTNWVETFPPNEETKLKLLEMSFENFRDENFYFMYADMVKCIAEEFLIEDFPESDNISSHVKITDGLELYFRDSRNLAYFIFNFRPSSDDKEDDFQEDIEFPNVMVSIFNNSRDEVVKTIESNLTKECENPINKSFECEVNQMDENGNADIVDLDLWTNIIESANSLFDEEFLNSQDGDQTMDEIVKKIIGDFSNLTTNFTKLSDYFNDLRKDDEHLSLNESEELSKYCFNKMKEIKVFKSDVDSLWDRFISMVQEKELSEDEIDEDEKKNSENTKHPSNHSNFNDECQSYSFTSPNKIRLLNIDYEVKNWTDVLVTVCEKMLEICLDKVMVFDKNPLLRGNSRQYFSYDPAILSKSAKRLSNNLFVETNFSSEDIVKLCGKIINICGYDSQVISFDVSKRQKFEKLHSANNNNIETIKFPLKYRSISVSEELLKEILSTISEYENRDVLYFESGVLKDELFDTIQSLSSYAQPQHILNYVLKFLIDWDVIDLYDGAKKGKYVIKDKALLDEMINDPRIINNLFENE